MVVERSLSFRTVQALFLGSVASKAQINQGAEALVKVLGQPFSLLIDMNAHQY